MTNVEAFDSKHGLLNKDILSKLATNKPNVSDVREIFAVFRSEPAFQTLTASLTNIENIVPARNQAALVGVSTAIRNLLVERTRQFVDDLLSFRALAFVTFRNFEKAFAEFLFKYEQVKSSELRNLLTKNLNQLNNRGLRQVYLDILRSEWIDNSLESSVKQSLSAVLEKCGNKLNPYLGEYRKNLHDLLNSYVNWCELPVKLINDNAYQVNSQSAILSRLIQKLKDKFPKDMLCPNNEIRLINSGCLFVDIDLDGAEYSGVNLVIVSETIKLVEGKKELRIVTDGTDAPETFAVKSAASGVGTVRKRGADGSDGSDGLPGSSAGHIYVVADDLAPVKIVASAKGGRGGSGQAGGDGANGRDGTDGKDGDRDEIEDELENGWGFNIWSYRMTRVGTDGEDGGDGGNAGCGGFEGDSGEPGLIKLVSLNHADISEYNNNDGVDQTNQATRHGEPGKPGNCSNL